MGDTVPNCINRGERYDLTFEDPEHWSPVVDVPKPGETCSCLFALKRHLRCGYLSRGFSPFHGVFGAHVPSMCPLWTLAPGALRCGSHGVSPIVLL